MKLFHGSNTEIVKINLEMCKPFKDFGKGFYLTSLPNQAMKMAAQTVRIFGGEPVVSVFDKE